MMKGRNSIELEHGFHRLVYATTIPILVSIDDEPKYVINGSGRIILRNSSGKVSLDPSEQKTEYNVSVISRESQYGEAVDPEQVVPAPTPPSNVLARLRQRVRDSMITTREAFAEHRSVYEVIDDLDEFEEEREARQNDTSSQDATSDTPAPTGDVTSGDTGEASDAGPQGAGDNTQS